MISAPVLVLNQNYQPLNVCTVRRAVVLLGIGKAEPLENGRGEVHTPSHAIPIPSVIRLMYLIKRPLLQRRLSRKEVFLRDNYTCLYCGRETGARRLQALWHSPHTGFVQRSRSEPRNLLEVDTRQQHI